jgi:hypothetical protein
MFTCTPNWKSEGPLELEASGSSLHHWSAPECSYQGRSRATARWSSDDAVHSAAAVIVRLFTPPSVTATEEDRRGGKCRGRPQGPCTRSSLRDRLMSQSGRSTSLFYAGKQSPASIIGRRRHGVSSKKGNPLMTRPNETQGMPVNYLNRSREATIRPDDKTHLTPDDQ